MNFKDYYKQQIYNSLFEEKQSQADVDEFFKKREETLKDYDRDISQSEKNIAADMSRYLKSKSGSSVSGLDPLNDNMPYEAGPADANRKDLSFAERHAALRHSESKVSKAMDPLGLKTIGRAADIHKHMQSFTAPTLRGSPSDIAVAKREARDEEYIDRIAKEIDYRKQLEKNRFGYAVQTAEGPQRPR